MTIKERLRIRPYTRAFRRFSRASALNHREESQLSAAVWQEGARITAAIEARTAERIFARGVWHGIERDAQIGLGWPWRHAEQIMIGVMRYKGYKVKKEGKVWKWKA
jgi:hypothetical protein